MLPEKDLKMAVQVYRHPSDIPLLHAMLVWSTGEAVGVVPHPDERRLSDRFRSSVGACFVKDWPAMSDEARKAQFMVDLWHVAAFYDIPAEAVHEAALSVPEYRDMLASDCLPQQYQHERD